MLGSEIFDLAHAHAVASAGLRPPDHLRPEFRDRSISL
jgi:hypothetical protein